MNSIFDFLIDFLIWVFSDSYVFTLGFTVIIDAQCTQVGSSLYAVETVDSVKLARRLNTVLADAAEVEAKESSEPTGSSDPQPVGCFVMLVFFGVFLPLTFSHCCFRALC